MEVLKVVAGPLSPGLLREHLAVPSVLTTVVHGRKVLEEQAGTVEPCQQRTIVIFLKGINSCLHVREVLPEQGCQILIKTPPIRYRSPGPRARPGALAELVPCPRCEPIHCEAVADEPGEPGQLPCYISSTGSEAGKGPVHEGLRAADNGEVVRTSEKDKQARWSSGR
jgi:hypothetical protein